MPLPTLENPRVALRPLHQANQLLSVIRFYLLPRDPNYIEWGTRVVAEGLSSDVLPGGSEIILDFDDQVVVVRQPDSAQAAIPINGHSQRSLFGAILAELQKSELAHVLSNDGDLVDQMIVALAVKRPSIANKHDDITDTAPLTVDPSAAQAYNTVLYSIFTGIARFKASRVNGKTTPAVVWGEHFDLSTLIFAGSEATEKAAHINFGFAPYSTGIDFPYLYAYAYPMKPNLVPTLPDSAQWHTEGWTGVVLPYTAIAAQDHPEQYIERMCDQIYTALLPLLA